MIFACDNCGFIFSRSEEFAQRMAELVREERAEAPRFPNLVETEISMLNTFSFRLPATALQIDSRMIVDIIVEYGQSADDENGLTGNVWARREGGRTTTAGAGESGIWGIERQRRVQRETGQFCKMPDGIQNRYQQLLRMI